MSGKVCLVTGATSGIGEITARALAQQGANVTIVGRRQERCDATLERIRQVVPSAELDAIVADLSSQAEVRRLAVRFRERQGRLDLLLNNAGGMFFERRETVDGIEQTLALNHLAYFLLSHLLLDLLKATAPARIVNVASQAHTFVRRIDLGDLERPRHYRGLRAYSQSKLANLLFTLELARRLEGTGVTVNALHPGFVATNIFAANGVPGWVMRQSARWFAITPEQGAETSIYLASSPEVATISGRYFYRRRPIAPSSLAQDADLARELWERSAALTGL